MSEKVGRKGQYRGEGEDGCSVLVLPVSCCVLASTSTSSTSGRTPSMARTRYRPALSDERAEALWVEHAGAQPEGWQIAMSSSCALRLLEGRAKKQVDLEGHPGDPYASLVALLSFPPFRALILP